VAAPTALMKPPLMTKMTPRREMMDEWITGVYAVAAPPTAYAASATPSSSTAQGPTISGWPRSVGWPQPVVEVSGLPCNLDFSPHTNNHGNLRGNCHTHCRCAKCRKISWVIRTDSGFRGAEGAGEHAAKVVSERWLYNMVSSTIPT